MARKIDESHETSDYMSDRETVSAGKLHFEGTVELGRTVTGQMLGILFGPESDVNERLRFGGPVQTDGTFRGAITTDDAPRVRAQPTLGPAITSGPAQHPADRFADEELLLVEHRIRQPREEGPLALSDLQLIVLREQRRAADPEVLLLPPLREPAQRRRVPRDDVTDHPDGEPIDV